MSDLSTDFPVLLNSDACVLQGVEPTSCVMLEGAEEKSGESFMH